MVVVARQIIRSEFPTERLINFLSFPFIYLFFLLFALAWVCPPDTTDHFRFIIIIVIAVITFHLLASPAKNNINIYITQKRTDYLHQQ